MNMIFYSVFYDALRAMPPEIYITFIIALGISVSIFVLYMINAKKTLNKISEILALVNPEIYGLFYYKLKGFYQGKEILIIFIPSSKGVPETIKIRVFTDSRYKFRIVEDDWTTTLDKKIGTIRDVSVMNQEFDKKYVINSKDAEITSRLMNQPKVQEIIDDILKINLRSFYYDNNRFNYFDVSNTRIEVRKPTPNIIDHIKKIFDGLIEITNLLKY